jgi:hypothetical protein
MKSKRCRLGLAALNQRLYAAGNNIYKPWGLQHKSLENHAI